MTDPEAINREAPTAEPAGVEPTPTGPESAQAAVMAAMAGLGGLDALPVTEHAEAFDRVHGALVDALSAIDGV